MEMMMVDWTKPIETVDGRKARVLTTDFVTLDGRSVVIAITNIAHEYIENVLPDGRLYASHTAPHIRNKPVKREGWVNVWRDGGYPQKGHTIYSTRDEALCKAKNWHLYETRYVATVRIEWEEPHA